MLGRSEEVSLTLAPWLRLTPPMELPLPIHGEMLLLAAEAALNAGKPDALKLLQDASEILQKNDVSSSTRLARVRAASLRLAGTS